MNTFPCPSCQNPTSPVVVRCPVCGWVLHTHLPKGTKLQNGKYTVGKKLGQGGFGITYLGANTLLGMPVAIKELFLDGSGRGVTQQVIPRDPQLFQADKNRFLHEARTLGQFNHPNVVRILDFFEENNTCYLVMEHLNGQTLSERLQGGVLTEMEVKVLLHSLLSGLEVVHTAGLLHRDIKPENIFLTHDGRVVLIDFGTARQFEVDKTSSHTRMVTPGYAPLEQYASSSRLSPASDIYSLGATLYHCLTGEMPPAATDRMSGEDLKVPVGSSGLMNLVESCLKLSVKERPQSMHDLRRLLEQPQEEAEPKQSWDTIAEMEQAAQQGNAEAQFQLAGILEIKYTGFRDMPQALFLYRQAAEQGHVKAQLELASLYLKGTDVPMDVFQAERWLQKAADQGHVEAQAELGWQYIHGEHFPKDSAKAKSYLTQAAERGNVRSQMELSDFYDVEYGIEKDLHMQIYWMGRAAESGDEMAMCLVGSLWKIDVKDYQMAAYWFQRGADLSDGPCQVELGKLYEHGQGVTQDHKMAFFWTQKAFQAGWKRASIDLARLYKEGIGVPKSDFQAVIWYKKAIELEVYDGHFYLAGMYEEGRGGLPKSIDLAIKHYQETVEKSRVMAYWAKKRLAELIPPEQSGS